MMQSMRQRLVVVPWRRVIARLDYKSVLSRGGSGSPDDSFAVMAYVKGCSRIDPITIGYFLPTTTIGEKERKVGRARKMTEVTIIGHQLVTA